MKYSRFFLPALAAATATLLPIAAFADMLPYPYPERGRWGWGNNATMNWQEERIRVLETDVAKLKMDCREAQEAASQCVNLARLSLALVANDYLDAAGVRDFMLEWHETQKKQSGMPPERERYQLLVIEDMLKTGLLADRLDESRFSRNLRDLVPPELTERLPRLRMETLLRKRQSGSLSPEDLAELESLRQALSSPESTDSAETAPATPSPSAAD